LSSSPATPTIRDLRFFLLERDEEPSAYSSGAVRLVVDDVVEFDVLGESCMRQVTDMVVVLLAGDGDGEEMEEE
jgi:hypothetical protein